VNTAEEEAEEEDVPGLLPEGPGEVLSMGLGLAAVARE
jgi:hypothetical protein